MKSFITFILLFPTLALYSQNIDIDLLKKINLNRNEHFDPAFRLISNYVAPVTYGVPILLLGINLMKKDSLACKRTLYIEAAVLSSAVISNIVKYSIHRTRPYVTYPFIEKAGSGGSPSFPSGHTSDAFVLATSLSIAYPKWYIIVPVYVWASTVAYSRMDLGVHYPADVLAGAVIGTASAYLCYKGQQWLSKKRNNDRISKFD